MKKRFEKTSDEWKMFTEFWALCQEVWEVENDTAYWEDAVNKVNAFGNKWGEKISLGRHMAVALMNYLEDKEKERKNGKTE